MFRVVLLALLVPACASCGKPATQDNGPANDTAGPKKIAPPPDKGPVATTGGPATPDDPKLHLQPDEGTLTIDKCDVKAGAEATAALKVAPGDGYHMSTDYPIKLTLEAPAGIKLAKTELTKGDADPLTEKALGLAIKATPEKAGSYEIKGLFKFGVCNKDSCHPKKQPVTITCTAT